MPKTDRFLDLALDVARPIAAAAEPAVAGSRWRTRTYLGESTYGTDVFAGSAGPVILFGSLFGATQEARYRDIAESGALWIESQTRGALTAPKRDLSLYHGVAGQGMTFLNLYEQTQRERWLDLSQTRAKALRNVSYSAEDVLAGAAGAGIFLIRLYQATEDPTVLDLASAAADHLFNEAIVNDDGWHWRWHRRSGTFDGIGFAHGAAGIAYFLAELSRYTDDVRAREAVLGAMQWIDVHAVTGPAWGRWPGDSQPPRVQWCHGAAGIGLFAIRAYAALGDRVLRDLALRAAEATHAAGDIRANPSQCHGLAGNAELFLEIHHTLDDTRWVERSVAFADAATAYRQDGVNGVCWQGDESGNDSPDFMMGSAGLAHFFLRLARGTDFEMPLMARSVRHMSQ